MNWFLKLFNLKEEPESEIAKDYSQATSWGIEADPIWQKTENNSLFELEKAGGDV